MNKKLRDNSGSLFFFFLGPHMQHMQDFMLGGLIRAAAAGLCHSQATRDLSQVHDLHHSSQQHCILNLLSRARDWTDIPWILVRFVSTKPQQEFQEWFTLDKNKLTSFRMDFYLKKNKFTFKLPLHTKLTN